MIARKSSDAGTPGATNGEGGDPSVPAKMRGKYDPIWALVERFCRERLDDEYLVMCRRLLGVLARKRPSPLVNGTAAGWAAGVVRAIGHVNFLDDKGRSPHVKTAEIDKAFGVSQATGAAKAKAIRDALKMRPFDPAWTLPSHMADNPLAYLVSVNGLILDARHAPAAVQRSAVGRGLIPPLPAEHDRTAEPAPRRAPHAGPPRLYTLDVSLLQGPITAAFARANREIRRTIQIRGDQTLADLHAAIFEAFDRWDAHLYEFRFGDGPDEEFDGQRYVLPAPAGVVDDGFDDGFDDGGPPPAGTVDRTTLDELGLTDEWSFGYLFDFGDDWWHQVDVIAVDATVPADGTYPWVTERVGRSPPQYTDADGPEA